MTALYTLVTQLNCYQLPQPIIEWFMKCILLYMFMWSHLLRYPLSDSQHRSLVWLQVFVSWNRCCLVPRKLWTMLFAKNNILVFTHKLTHIYAHTHWDEASVIENQVEICATWVMTQMPPIELRQICCNITSIQNATKLASYRYDILIELFCNKI